MTTLGKRLIQAAKEGRAIARKALEKKRPGLAAYLRTFPGGEFERNRSPSRDVEHSGSACRRPMRSAERNERKP